MFSCSYSEYGSGGGIKKNQAVCVLPNNVVHQVYSICLEHRDICSEEFKKKEVRDER